MLALDPTLAACSGCSDLDDGEASSIYDAVPLTATTCIRLLERVESINFLMRALILKLCRFVDGSTSQASPGSASCISLKLYTVDQRDFPEYVCLSYMWGDEPASKEIVLNGRAFLVRENLWNFLDRAKDADLPHHGPLWIDAICINQHDLIERGDQVRAMGKIYGRARITISWLGIDDEVYADGLDCVPEVCHQRNTEVEPDPKKLESLARIYHHEYWTRTWILQEVVLPREVEIWIGFRSIGHEILFDTKAWLFSRLSVDFKSKAQFAHQVLERRATQHFYDGYIEGSMLNMYNLLELLKMMRGTRCKDVRDRLFAIIALISAEQRGELEIVPDYTKSPHEIYRELARNIARCLEAAGSFRFDEFSVKLRELLEIDPPQIGGLSGRTIDS